MNLADLRQAVAPLSAIGSGELSFEFEGIPIKIRTLTPEEEISAFRYARDAVSESEPSDRAAGLEYIDRFRLITLSHSIMRVGGVDFSGVSYVETGETLQNGTPVRVTKSEALLEAMNGWSREMMTALFTRFSDLQFQVDERLAAAVAFDDIDYEGEIARLEERITELKDQKARRTAAREDPRSTSIAEASKPRPRRPAAAPAPVAAPDPEPEPADLGPEFESHSVALPLDIPKAVFFAPEEPAPEPAPVPEPPAPPPVPASVFDGVRLGPSPFTAMEIPREELPLNKERKVPTLPLRPPHVSAFEAYQGTAQENPEPPPAAPAAAPATPGLQTRFRPVKTPGT